MDGVSSLFEMPFNQTWKLEHVSSKNRVINRMAFDNGIMGWRSALDALIETGEVPGLVGLVQVDDEVYVHAAGTCATGIDLPMKRDTIFRIASMTKPVSAAAAMILVDEGRIALDEPVDAWLPELADRRVLKRLDGPLDDTVPAVRSVTLRELLTLRMGLGHIMAPCSNFPIRRALNERGLLMGIPSPHDQPAPDVWMARVGDLPLMHQPGEAWMYDLGLDVLGVLIARVAKQALDAFMRERIFAPLGMNDTGFFVPEANVGRLSASHERNPASGRFEIQDGIEDSQYRFSPDFPAAASGLVSTADDYLLFCRMLLNHGRHEGLQLLSNRAVAQMTTSQLTPEQHAANRIFFGDHGSWGFGMSVTISPDKIFPFPGTFGWTGGRGTYAYSDPTNRVTGILMTNRNLDSPEPPKSFTTFWNTLYDAMSG